MSVTNRMASTATSYSLSRVMDTMRSCKATLGQSQGTNTAQPADGKLYKDYKRNTFQEKDVLTARWQWEPLSTTQTFNVLYPLAVCTVQQQEQGLQQSWSLCVCQKGKEDTWSYSTVLGWINLTSLSLLRSHTLQLDNSRKTAPLPSPETK